MSPASLFRAASAREIADEVLKEFVEAAQRALGDDLRSIVLFGSAAEGKLRATSDVNVVLVLSAFDPAKADSLPFSERGPAKRRPVVRRGRTNVEFLAALMIASVIAVCVVGSATRTASCPSGRRPCRDSVHSHRSIDGWSAL